MTANTPPARPRLVKMNRDASGKTAAAEPSSADTASKKGANGKAKPQNAGQVTRTIKGVKEVVIQIDQLKGKGYPGPVDLDSGVAPRKAVARKKK